MNKDNDPPEVLVFSEDFGDPETLLNSRNWLRNALEAKGAIFDGGGIGMGKADIDITLEGYRYNISIRPLQGSEEAVDELIFDDNMFGVKCPECGIDLTVQNAGGYRTYCDKHAEAAAEKAIKDE